MKGPVYLHFPPASSYMMLALLLLAPAPCHMRHLHARPKSRLYTSRRQLHPSTRIIRYRWASFTVDSYWFDQVIDYFVYLFGEMLN